MKSTPLGIPPPPFTAYWLAETLRLREEHWGPIEDSQECRRARQAPENLTTRIQWRAVLLARRERLDTLLARWRQIAILSLLLLVVLALIAGASTAVGVLGNGAQAINVLWALGALLGLNSLTFLFWLISFLLPLKRTANLGRAWLWLTSKLARGPNTVLIPQALLNLLARSAALRWLLGTVSHLLWLVALCAALATLLLLLSTASYRFVWATTLLSPDAFWRLTAWMGWLPAQWGIALPDAAIVRASDGQQALPMSAQAQWAQWLLGVLVCWGILPRLVAALLCLGMSARALGRLHIDVSLPGYATLRERLLPTQQTSTIDRPATALHTPRVAATSTVLTGQPVLASLELPSDLAPPLAPAPPIYDAGNMDTREERNALLDALAATPTPRLLLLCDARQTPDRGTLSLIAALSAYAGQTRIWLRHPDINAQTSRQAQWRERLRQAGMPDTALMQDADQPLSWLLESTKHG